MVESDDEAGLHLEARVLEHADVFGEIPATILGLPHSLRLATSVVSMPTKTVSKPDRTICATRSGSSARSMETWVYRGVGPCCSCHLTIWGRRSFLTAAHWPMKLSSTTKTVPVQPARRMASSSAMTWAGALPRGPRPSMAVTLQKSQLKGQPREYCTLSEEYWRWSRRLHMGMGRREIGVLVRGIDAGRGSRAPGRR